MDATGSIGKLYHSTHLPTKRNNQKERQIDIDKIWPNRFHFSN